MDARWHLAVEQLRARERPVHYIRFWLRELTACLPGRARSAAQLRDSACALYIILMLRPGLLWLLDLLMGAFAVLVATGLRPLACIGRTRHGLGVSLAVIRAALQGRFGSAHCAAGRAPRVQMHFGGDAWVVEPHVAPIWDKAPVPLRRACDWMPQLWWDRPADRLSVVSGWLDVQCLGQAGHFVGVTWHGEVLCPHFGRVPVGDVEGAAQEILRRMPFVEEFWYFLLPPPGAVGEWPAPPPSIS